MAPKGFRRAIVVVCDGLGVGAAPDAARFGDQGSDTLGHVLASCRVSIPNLFALGIGNLTAAYDGARNPRPVGASGKMAERSAGKDTAAGHWEIAGLVTERAFRTFIDGFPPEIIEPFEARIGRKVLGNKAASGTEILKELGEEHLRTGQPIVYTSQDSVFQIAAHEDVLSPERLYEICHVAHEIACLQHGVCRVIARPFVGRSAAEFRRTPARRDFPVAPPGETLLDRLSARGLPVCGIGKISDIFTGRGVSEAIHTHSDAHGIEETLAAMTRLSSAGMIFTNLVDFDTLYGHRNDVPGYAANLEMVDARLGEVFARMKEDDLFVLTGDHGCDPSDASTDHTREYVPVLARGAGVRPVDLGVRPTFADLGATLAEAFDLGPLAAGTSFLSALSLCASA